jgi:hypothetical protein
MGGRWGEKVEVRGRFGVSLCLKKEVGLRGRLRMELLDWMVYDLERQEVGNIGEVLQVLRD